MATVHNEIVINAPVEKIWQALSNIEQLEKYDPTVKTSVAKTSEKSGIGSARKVDMKDGKNWFEEKCTVYNPNEKLAYELTNCSFPIDRLKHSYSFEKMGNQTKVKQIMDYQVKYGLLGKALDGLMIRKQTDIGIKRFFAGLKEFVENSSVVEKNGEIKI